MTAPIREPFNLRAFDRRLRAARALALTDAAVEARLFAECDGRLAEAEARQDARQGRGAWVIDVRRP